MYHPHLVVSSTLLLLNALLFIEEVEDEEPARTLIVTEANVSLLYPPSTPLPKPEAISSLKSEL